MLGITITIVYVESEKVQKIKLLIQTKALFLVKKHFYYGNAFLFFVYPLKIVFFGNDIFSEAIMVICIFTLLYLTFIQLWNHITRTPRAWSLIGLGCIATVFMRLMQMYFSSQNEEKVISPGDNLWLLSVIRDFADFGNTRNSHAISGVGYFYHIGSIVHLSVLAQLHDFFVEFGLIFLMPIVLYLFSSLQILKITSLLTSSSRSQILALVYFTFVPITIFSGSLEELFSTVRAEPTFRYSYYLPTYYGFALVFFLILITLRSNLYMTLIIIPLLQIALYSTKPVFLIATMPLTFFIIIGRVNESFSQISAKLYYLSIFCSQLCALVILLPRTELSSPFFVLQFTLQDLDENLLKAQNQTIAVFLFLFCFGILRNSRRLSKFQLTLVISLILTSFFTFISTKIFVLTFSDKLSPEVLTNLKLSLVTSGTDYSALLANDAQVLYLVVAIYSLLTPVLTWNKENDFYYQAIRTCFCFAIIFVQGVQISGELLVFAKEGRFLSEDNFNYGSYASSLSRIPVSQSLILTNDIANPIKNYSRPNSADYLSAFTDHSFYISRLGWQSFNDESWKRIEEVGEFFTTSDLNFVLNFLQTRKISHIAIHSRCSDFGREFPSTSTETWDVLTARQLRQRLLVTKLPINFEEPKYGVAKCL